MRRTRWIGRVAIGSMTLSALAFVACTAGETDEDDTSTLDAGGSTDGTIDRDVTVPADDADTQLDAATDQLDAAEGADGAAADASVDQDSSSNHDDAEADAAIIDAGADDTGSDAAEEIDSGYDAGVALDAGADGGAPQARGRLAVGFSHGCFVLASGKVKCWGLNDRGQLGDGTTTNRTTPVEMLGVSDEVSVVASQLQTCVLTSIGDVYCVGGNTYGQVGDGTTTDRSTPVKVNVSSIKFLYASDQYTYAITTSGQLKMWGYANDHAAMLKGTGGNKLSPYDVVGMTDLVEISGDIFASCFRRSNGSTECWGNNNLRQLGRNNTSNSYFALPAAPTGIASGSAVRIVSRDSGDSHAVITTSGTYKTWGANFGASGYGAAANVNTPLDPAVEVALPTAVVDVSLGALNSYVVLDDGRVYGAGDGAEGKVGDGTTTTRLSFVQVAGLTNAVSVAGGWRNACALSSDDSVWCWGRNSSGELGNGTNTNSSVPVQVIDLP